MHLVVADVMFLGHVLNYLQGEEWHDLDLPVYPLHHSHTVHAEFLLL